MKHICVWLIRFYQKFLSPLQRNPTCRFTPTCSAYAVEAYQKRGFFIGTILTVWRILRCNPFSKGGYDPVPEKGFTNPKLRTPRADEIEEEKESVYRSSGEKDIPTPNDGSDDSESV